MCCFTVDRDPECVLFWCANVILISFLVLSVPVLSKVLIVALVVVDLAVG